MPSIRKRIGYLPSHNIQEIITNIAKKEKLSQSKVVGILVEEALSARSRFDLRNSNDLMRKNLYGKENNMYLIHHCLLVPYLIEHYQLILVFFCC